MGNYLIIGASSGIGKQLALQLADSGNQVYGTYNKTEAESTNNLISYHPLNVLDETLNLEFLPDTLNGLVYCPGSINLKPFGRITPADFLDDYNLQVVGAIKLTDTPLASTLLSTNEKKEANAAKNPLKKNGDPGDIANMAEFLLSDKASWITGQVFHVDGGFSTIKK